MAEKTELQPFQFNIENTMEMGLGDTQLLDDFLGAETSTASPDEVSIIKDEPVKPIVKKKIEAKPKEDEAKVVEKIKQDDQEDLKNALFGEDEENDEVESTSKSKEVSKDKEGDEDEDQTPVNVYDNLAKDLFKLNVFTKDEDEQDVEIKTPEEFLDRFNLEKKKGAIETLENFIGQFGEDYQNAFQAIFVKGVDPKEYYSTYNNIQNFAQMDLSKEGNQETIIRKTFEDQGLESEDIDKEIEKLKNFGDLEATSQRYHKILVKKEAVKLQQIEQQKEQQLTQLSTQKKQYTTNVQNVLQDKLKEKQFDGIPLNQKLASELQDFLVTDKYKTPSGETLTEFDKTILDLKRPENHSMKVKLALLLKVLEKDPTLSTLQKTATSKQVDTLFGNLTTDKKSSKASSTKGNSLLWNL